jgi:hypothetical protein
MKAAALAKQGKRVGADGWNKGMVEAEEEDDLWPFPFLRGASRKPNRRDAACGAGAHHDRGLDAKSEATLWFYWQVSLDHATDQ